MLKLGRVTKVRMLFLVLVFVFNFDLFKFSAAILKKGLLERRSLKNQGFNGIRTRDLRDTGAMLYQLSHEATHWKQGKSIQFVFSRAVEMMWSLYEIIHICTAVIDESEEWSSR